MGILALAADERVADVKFTKAARLLRDGGWLALMATAERYDEPFGAALRDMWRARSDGGAWTKQSKLSDTEIQTIRDWISQGALDN